MRLERYQGKSGTNVMLGLLSEEDIERESKEVSGWAERERETLNERRTGMKVSVKKHECEIGQRMKRTAK